MLCSAMLESTTSKLASGKGSFRASPVCTSTLENHHAVRQDDRALKNSAANAWRIARASASTVPGGDLVALALERGDPVVDRGVRVARGKARNGEQVAELGVGE